MDAAMVEAAKQTERVRSRAGSTPHLSTYGGYHGTSGWQSPDTIGERNLYGSPGRVLSPATPLPLPEIPQGEHLQNPRYLESSEETGTAEANDAPDQDFQSSTASLTTTTSGSLESDEENFEWERERRREEVFERMRKVLDDGSNGFVSCGDDVRSEK
ncbi:hypothetical protein H2248_010067 [Termitomyces sp. 'cryptogamus']|nr:hypothetical protein H2248_010067 [Termitomyces sp. 'cryptogamus']